MTNTPPAEAAAPMIRFCDVNKKYGSYHALVDIRVAAKPPSCPYVTAIARHHVRHEQPAQVQHRPDVHVY